MFPFPFSDDTPQASPKASELSYYVFTHQLLYEQVLQAQSDEHRPVSLLDLPEDILIDIFVRAASQPRSARSLALSCKYISTVTRNVRLHSILVRDTPTLVSFRDFVCAEPDERNIAAAVKNMWLATSGDRKVEQVLVSEILRACKNIIALTAHVSTIAGVASVLGHDFPHRDGVRLTIIDNIPTSNPFAGKSFWTFLSDADHTGTLMHNLTHLHFSQYFPGFSSNFAQTVPHLPRLTHIALPVQLCPEDYHAEIRDFAEMLSPLNDKLLAAVLIFREVPWYMPPLSELVKTARSCGPTTMVLLLQGAWNTKELKFWRKCVFEGENVWSLAKMQMATA